MFFWSDLLGACLATFISGILFFFPGLLAAKFFNLCGFRGLRLVWRIVVAIPVSIAISPILIYLLLRFCGIGVVYVAVGLLCLTAAWHARHLRFVTLRQLPRSVILLGSVWTVGSILMVVDLQFGHRLYFPGMAVDHAFRVAVIDAITRTGLPPVSPFNYFNGPVLMRYHIFWFAMCSVVQRLGCGFLTARDALNGSIVWCGLSLFSLIPLALRFFQEVQGPLLKKRAWIGIALLTVTGLDLIPILILAVRRIVPPPDMEWWSHDQVTSWADAILWVPHHVSALVAGFTAFCLLWYASRNVLSKKAVALHGLVAGAGFASATGCSVYVGVMFAILLSLWTVITFLKKWRLQTIVLIQAGAIAAVLAFPNLLTLRASASGAKFLGFGLWYPAGNAELIQHFGVQSMLVKGIIKILCLVGTYIVELGAFVAIGIGTALRMRKRARSPQDLAFIVFAGGSFALCTFVRSATISNNDFGWRGFMVTQLLLLLVGTEILAQPPNRSVWRSLVSIMLVIGAVGTCYQLTWLRFQTILADAGAFGNSVDTNMGSRTYSLRSLYRQLESRLPAYAVIQSNPNLYVDFWEGLYSHHQTVSTGPDCLSAMGGDLNTCRHELPVLQKLFLSSTKDPTEAEHIARRFHIQAVVLMDIDEIWDASDTWIEKRKPDLFTEDALVYLFP